MNGIRNSKLWSRACSLLDPRVVCDISIKCDYFILYRNKVQGKIQIFSYNLNYFMTVQEKS